MAGDLGASGTNPGTTYTILPTSDPGVYHEDRVVVTAVGSTYVTQMFRVYGATFLDGTWTYVGASTAYATVQNQDGSIHYFTYSGPTGWTTSEWEGSDNNTVYNAVDFGVTAGGSASDNATALGLLFTALTDAAVAGAQCRFRNIISRWRRRRGLLRRLTLFSKAWEPGARRAPTQRFTSRLATPERRFLRPSFFIATIATTLRVAQSSATLHFSGLSLVMRATLVSTSTCGTTSRKSVRSPTAQER